MRLKQIDDKSSDLTTLRSLLARRELSPRQRSDIKKEIDNIVTGHRGEQQAAYFLDDAFADAENTALIHDIRIEHEGRSAQIDHLLLTRIGWAYVLETKNLNASLECNEAGEWTAWYNKRPYAIASPIEQARRHAAVLKAWLEARNITMRSFESVVVVSPTSLVGGERAHGDEKFPVIRADLFKRWWERQRVTTSTLNILWAVARAWSPAEFEAIAKSVAAAHQPVSRDWAMKFGLSAVAPASASEAPGAPRLEEAIEREPSATETDALDGHVVRTSLGSITVRRVGDGRFALRHAADPKLADQLATVVGEGAQWQPRFKNWLINPQDVVGVLSKLKAL